MFIIMPTEKRLKELEVERAWRAKNKDVLKEKKRQYYLTHKEHHNEVVNKKREQKLLDINIMRKGVITEFYNGCCDICGESELCCLVFHHLNGEEKDKKWGRLEYMLPLYEKWLLEGPDPNITILCWNCHVKVHRGVIYYKNTPPPSSTLWDFCKE
jgi:hypothetical protein